MLKVSSEAFFMKNSCNIQNYPQLLKPYKIIAFDWDGTAVKDRKSDASSITRKLEELLKLEIYIVIITGTNFDNINNQFASFIKGKHKQYLYLCTNRGSEVFGFDENSNNLLLYKRIASSIENELLDKIAERTKFSIENISNANIKIIYNRLNRRKIDLLPSWIDPKKSEIDKLLNETEKNLLKNGFAGGIKKAYVLLSNHARAYGLNNARITTDVKHLEIGLTDKADSIVWILENIAEKNNIKDDEILVGGDEFGEIAGFEGSDSKMILSGKNGLIYFSVGIEPNGVPDKVILVGGGTGCFEKIIAKQVDIHRFSC
jgi:hydroxymethylpyrimidine pyrophosphatase-like HAD family hydrolase